MDAEVAGTQQPIPPDNTLPREPAKAFPGKLQTPPAGSFNFFALTWDSKISKGRTVQEAFVSSDRIPDLIKGGMLAML